MGSNGETVRLENAEQMNLLGLLFQGYLHRQLQSPRLRRKAARLRADIGIQAGTMGVTLSFGEDGIVLRSGITEKPTAWVAGPMQEMLSLVGRGGGFAAATVAVLEGRIATGGSLWALWRALPILLPSRSSGAPPSHERSES